LFVVSFILDRFDDDDDDDDDGGRGGGEGEGVGTIIIDKGDGDLDVPETTLLSDDAFEVDEEGFFFTTRDESIEAESRVIDGASCGLTTNEGALPLIARGLVVVVVVDDDDDDDDYDDKEEEEFFARASATS
jgi:hypothetical protein